MSLSSATEPLAESAPASPGRRTALITGASSGIGEAYAIALAAKGWDLVLVARRTERLEALAAKLSEAHGIRAEVLTADLTTEPGLAAVEARLRGEPAVRLLINNAGFGTHGAFADLDIAREEEEVRLNVLALVRLTHAALPGMAARRSGAIINVSSMASFFPGPYMATYYATKAFVTSFTESLAEELRGTGVRMQALCPGMTTTEFQARAHIRDDEGQRRGYMTAEFVVDWSLRDLERGNVVSIPGRRWGVLRLGARFVPRGLVRRVSGRVNR